MKYFPFRKRAKSISRFRVQGKFFLFAEEMKCFINVELLLSGEASADLAKPIWESLVLSILFSQRFIKCLICLLSIYNVPDVVLSAESRAMIEDRQDPSCLVELIT